jgi:hypothetical protein
MSLLSLLFPSLSAADASCRSLIRCALSHWRLSQLPDLPLSPQYCDHVLNSALLLLHVSLPPAARHALALPAAPVATAVLTLPPIRCSGEDVTRRLQALLSCLRLVLCSPGAVKPGTVMTANVATVMKLLLNVRLWW